MGEQVPEYRSKGPLSQQERKETHGLIWSFRQPFTHAGSGYREKNDWMVERRENRPGYSSHGADGEESVSSVRDSEDAGSMSPRMRDALIARFDATRREETARSDINPVEFRAARDENGNAVAFNPDNLKGK